MRPHHEQIRIRQANKRNWEIADVPFQSSPFTLVKTGQASAVTERDALAAISGPVTFLDDIQDIENKGLFVNLKEIIEMSAKKGAVSVMTFNHSE